MHLGLNVKKIEIFFCSGQVHGNSWYTSLCPMGFVLLVNSLKIPSL